MSDVRDDIVPPVEPDAPARPRLSEIEDFGSNPGNLAMWLWRPQAGLRKVPLVVVLHGCTQSANGYDAAAKWVELGHRHGFMVLYPEQRRENNSNTCFSWFDPADTRRGSGETESIRQMIETAVVRFGADKRQVFICGLSAGGAMAGALLATHPELFAGGTIIAGLPFGTATNVSEAYESMSNGRIKDAKVWGDLVRVAAADGGPATGRWPTVAIWHGTADKVVRPINAGELVKQWTNVHRLGAQKPAETQLGHATRRVWSDAAGRESVVSYTLPGLAHGAPVDDIDPPAPFFLPAGISSTWQIARDWGLTARNPARLLMSIFGL